MRLTEESIRADIKAYQDRLSRAEAKLFDLPGGLKGRKLAQTRRVLLSKIRHVQTLINYAQEALTEVVG